MKEAHLVPDRYSFGGADLDTGRCERLQVTVMIPGDDLNVWDYFDETLKELRDILPFFELNLRDRMFHVTEQNELSRMGVVDYLTKLLKKTRDL
jgi:hypothetical protein